MNYQAILDEAKRSCLKGQYEWARQCYDKLAEFLPDDGEPYIGLGVIEFEQDNLDQAEICFRVACRLMPESSRGHCGLGMVEQKRRNFQKAAKYFLDSYLFDRENFGPILGLCEVSKQSQSYDVLKVCLERYIEDHPEDTSTILMLACLHIRDKDYWKAQLIINEAKDFELKATEGTNLKN